MITTGPDSDSYYKLIYAGAVPVQERLITFWYSYSLSLPSFIDRRGGPRLNPIHGYGTKGDISLFQ